ncbi:MAG: DUF305 domain-containing protein [Gemmatimonas sp.]
MKVSRTFVQRSLKSFAVVALFGAGSSLASAQGATGGMAGMHHHMAGPEIVIPKGAKYTKADVEFMQGMIAHHAQAVVMSKMAEAHGASPQVLKLSRKIDQSQIPEIQIMQDWLKRHDQFAPDTSSWRTMSMMGMLTDAQMKELDASKGVDFDRAYLSYMIMHHEGAIKMVDDLFAAPMSGQEVDVNTFATDVVTVQSSEISIMQSMLSKLPAKQ